LRIKPIRGNRPIAIWIIKDRTVRPQGKFFWTNESSGRPFYQAKSIKGYLYELRKDELEMELKMSGAKTSKSLVDEFGKRIEFYSKNIKRYNEEKAEIQWEAKKFESLNEDAQKHAQIFGIAVIFLQIAILLSSIAALMKEKIVWIMGLIIGVFGLIYFANGFFLFLPVKYALF
jgi:hypothetical protein